MVIFVPYEIFAANHFKAVRDMAMLPLVGAFSYLHWWIKNAEPLPLIACGQFQSVSKIRSYEGMEMRNFFLEYLFEYKTIRL